ncbi:hypothetical protein CFP56_029352, partial [Quercus suber]
ATIPGAARSKVPWQKQSNVKTKVQHDKGEKSKQAASTSGHDEVCEKEDRGDVSVVNGSTVGMVHACQQECEGTRSGLVGLGKDRVGPKEVQGSHVTASAKADKPTTVIDFSAEKSGPTLLTRAWKRLARDVGKNQKDNEEGGMLMTVSNTVDNGKRLFRIHHLDAFHSDHKPLLLCSDSEFKRFYRKGRPFRFEAMWLKDSTCEDVIKQSWEGESSPNIDWGFNRKITACQLNLKAWNRNCFGHVRNTLAKKLKDLKWAEEEGCYASNPVFRIHHLDAFHSDHKPLLLCSDSEFKRFYRKGRPFRFEAMWLKDSTCEDVIKQSWEGESSPNIDRGFNRKITACQLNLRAWNRNYFGHVRNTLAKKLKDLKWAEEEGCYASNPGKIYQLREEIQKLKYREESMWKQRSRNAWLKEGDSNTRYFHCRANQRNQRNFISGLEDNDGGWVEEESRLGGIVEDYFRTIFSSSNPSGFDSILQGIHPAITEEAAELLGRDFQADEVGAALKQMAPLTAPGPDGMSPVFYKSFWHIVGEDVTAVVLKALNTGVIPESLNSTFIALIPKIKHPKKVSDFRPISLCNVAYKLISKVVVNRLKKF